MYLRTIFCQNNIEKQLVLKPEYDSKGGKDSLEGIKTRVTE
jgi:hypothetical protein